MGTRSITVVKDELGRKIIEMYKQYDGYPSGFGVELRDFIKSGKLVNGIPVGDSSKMFNGMNCFAAQLVAEFKDGAGGVYLHYPEEDFKNKKKYADLYNAEYYYEIAWENDVLTLKCWDTYENKEVEIPND